MILSTIGLSIGAYALGAGAISSAAMVARGGVRAVGAVIHGDARGAALELLGGVAAPAVGAVKQLTALGGEIIGVAMSICATSAGPGDTSLPGVSRSEADLGWSCGVARRLAARAAGA